MDTGIFGSIVLGLPEVIFAWLLGRIDQRVEFESDFPVDPFYLQHFRVHRFMVMRAQHHAVFGARFPVV